MGGIFENDEDDQEGLTIMEDHHVLSIDNINNDSNESTDDQEPDGSNGTGFTADHHFNEQEGDEDNSEESKPIGLKMTVTPSFLNLLKARLAEKQENQVLHSKSTNRDDHLRSRHEKSKASNFPAITLNIGTWKRFAMHEGELVAKFYFAKQRIVWEILDGAVKCKIEIQWSDIIAIRGVMLVNEPGVLEIELKQPPMFYRESNPTPRRHTNWSQTSDFTGGQATNWRIHGVRFAPGLLDKHFEKLLKHDQRLFILSQRPFPSLDNPYFQSNMNGISLNFNGYRSSFHPGSQHPYPTYTHSIRETPSRLPPNSSNPAMNLSPFIGQQNGSSNHQALAQQQTVNWNPRVNFPEVNLNFSGGPSHVSSINQSNRGDFSSQNHGLDVGMLSEIDKYLMEGSQVEDAFSLLEPVDVDGNNYTNRSETNYQVKNNGGAHVINNAVANNNNYLPINWQNAEELNRRMTMEATVGYPSNAHYFSNVNPNGYVHSNQASGGFVPGMNPY